jgi:UDP-glucuronate 4-epimerase
MNILVTGAAGFIGFSFINHLINNKKFNIIGIDNLDRYYSVKLKNKRIKILKKNKNFIFKKIDITQDDVLYEFLANKKFDLIFHFAAQAGVRYVTVNPNKYLNDNIIGFFNILKIVLLLKPKKFFYASSSSVYGDISKFPTTESIKLKPKNIYGLTKKINEEIIDLYCSNVKTKFIGLRFFTVYGEWGRPDMLLIKFMIASLKKKIFKIHNYGNHVRDFTYIGDVVNALKKLIYKRQSAKHVIFNICSSKPIPLKFIIEKLIKLTNFKIIKKVSAQKIEVFKTFGSNKKLLKIIGKFKFYKFDEGLKNTYIWFIKNKKYLIN